MKGSTFTGKFVEIDGNLLTFVVKLPTGAVETKQYPLGLDELDETWVGANLGTWMTVVVIDGKVMGFHNE